MKPKSPELFSRSEAEVRKSVRELVAKSGEEVPPQEIFASADESKTGDIVTIRSGVQRTWKLDPELDARIMHYQRAQWPLKALIDLSLMTSLFGLYVLYISGFATILVPSLLVLAPALVVSGLYRLFKRPPEHLPLKEEQFREVIK